MNLPCNAPLAPLGKISDPSLLQVSRRLPKRNLSDGVEKTSRERLPSKKKVSEPKHPEFVSRFTSKHPGVPPSSSSSPSRSSRRRSPSKPGQGSPGHRSATTRVGVSRSLSTEDKRRLASMARKIRKLQREIQSDQTEINELSKENAFMKEKLKSLPKLAQPSQELLDQCQRVEEQMLQLDAQLFEKNQNESQESLEFFLGFTESSPLSTPDLSWVPDFAKANLSIGPLPQLAPHQCNSSSHSVCSQISRNELYFL